MKQIFAFALVILTATSCQINVMQPDANDPNAVVPDMNARIGRIVNVGGQDGKTVYSDERYEYNSSKQIARINRSYRNATGQLALSAYDEYTYNGQQKLQAMTSYAFRDGKLFVTGVKQYEYPASNKILERSFTVDNTGKPTLEHYRTETVMDGNRKAQTTAYYFDGKTFLKSFGRVYRYESGRLVSEESLNQSGAVMSTFRYVYKGRTATVGEFMTNRAESISEQKFDYDNRDRLVRSEVTQMNPLLCVAFTAGSSTVYEYVD